MDTDVEKVYVAVGNDLQDGLKTLAWTLAKFESQPFSIVILYLTYDISRDLVYTPLGCKLPATSVSDEVLEDRRKHEEGKIEELLSKYKAFCAKVKAETLKIRKSDEPVHKLLLDLISELRITKLVMGIAFMKSPSGSGKSRSAISGSFFVHLHKPEYCELFIICGGKLVFLKGNNEEGVMEDDQGVRLARMRGNLRSRLTKIFTENYSMGRSSHLPNSPRNLDSPDSQNNWENHVQEIENYFYQLMSLNLDEANPEAEYEVLQTSPMEAILVELEDSNMSVAEKVESLKSKLKEAEEMIQLHRKEAKTNTERCKKAQWAICLCTTSAEKLESLRKEELASRLELQENLDDEKEQLYEITRDVEESKKRLSSVSELLSELSNKLQLSTIAKGHAEKQLEREVTARAEMVREIEELRRQRDVLHRRIEFCKEKDAIAMVTRSSDELISCGYKEYAAEEIRVATDDFSEHLRLKRGEDWTNVYRGRIHFSSVAIKMLSSGLSHDDFQATVKLLTNIRHPHLVAIMGFCSDLRCIVLEYMHNGNLRDILFTSKRNYSKHGRALWWADRIRIAQEVCSAVGFLHSAEPRPIVHGHLTPSNILLDRNLVAKISCAGLGRFSDQCDERLDVRAFGVVLLHLLAGRNWAALLEEATMLDQTALVQVLDEMAGRWPLDLAKDMARIAMKCLSVCQEAHKDLRITSVTKELHELRKKADGLAARGVSKEVTDTFANKEEDSTDIPRVFLCPIFQEVMKNPHVAADGFSYELEAMEEWLGTGHDTSPMTNLRLDHKFLTPNLTLRSLIQDWLNKDPTVSS
ncbi:putative U-box domain-containing protein 50 isoform X2 [Mangifera indica]|uniref:putative U-box domain-containing protein 50 isoform X2 n=1 Tax=Mangifera indica TaxID=29780 RepID=UPI001CFC03BD|nr:putative U-box domain-containing protein 50 isoform X2 [Mangifera indica]XP_044469911.1 putative U-box domain-containing protein 50 isoform X2 [Mangifera indica]